MTPPGATDPFGAAGSRPRLLVLEPYFGGSHRDFLHNLAAHLPFSFKLLTLPARQWKWRMRLSAPYFADLMRGMEPPELVFCSTFVDVAALRGLAPAWIRQVPVLTYFHENQFVYPVQKEDARDLHFALTNYTTALASDGLAFNSRYNLDTFLTGLRGLLDKAADIDLTPLAAAIPAKSVILPPGLDFQGFDPAPRRENGAGPVIVWNHRHEHDKNPARFFEAMYRLDQEGIAFKLVVLGQTFRASPAIFAEARERLAHRLLHWGYVESRQEYINWLQRGTVVVSTAGHEFFGLAIIEAVRAGCRPVLPDRLAYPELFPATFRYADQEFYPVLVEALRQGALPASEAIGLTEALAWPRLAKRYQDWFAGFLNGRTPRA